MSSSVAVEGSVTILQRATGFFSFWNKTTPSYAKLVDTVIHVYPSKSTLIPTTSLYLNEYDYEVLQLSDYVNGIAISKMLQHGTAETVIEMILPGETEMFSWMKNLIRIQALKQNKAGDHSLVETTGPLAALSRAFSESSKIPKMSITFQSAVTIVVVLKRGLKRRRSRNAAMLIQSLLRMHIQRQAYKTRLDQIVTVQSLVRRWLHRNDLHNLKLEALVNKYQPQRARIVMEIYATESNYIQQLDTLVKVFMKPLKALEKKAGVTSDQIIQIFGNVDDIVEKHRLFYADLSKAVESFNENSIVSEAFIKMTEWLAIYIPYCNNFDEAKATLAKCQKIPAFQSFIETVDAVKTLKRLDINSFLILPVQRIPRYELLLKDLIKKTWDTHPDYDNLNVALGKIREAAKQVNRAKSYNESKHRIASIQSHIHTARPLSSGSQTLSLGSIKLGDSSNQLEQRYIGEGPLVYQELRKVIGKGKSVTAIHDIDDILAQDDDNTNNFSYEKEGKEVQVYGFLFHDTLVLTKRGKQNDLSLKLSGPNRRATFKYDHFLNISLERAFLDNASVVEKSKENSFVLQSADERYHKFQAENAESRKKWINDIQEAFDQLSKAQEVSIAADISDLLSTSSIAELEEPKDMLDIESHYSSNASSIKSPSGPSKEKSKLFPKLFRSSDTLDLPKQKGNKKGSHLALNQ